MDRDEERFAEKIRIEGECWIWTAATSVNRRTGLKYPTIYMDGKKSALAHRWAYRTMVGPIPEGLTLDHLCKNTLCVNPFHLEPVTLRENILRGGGACATNARKTHCIRGHKLAGKNLYVNPQGHRKCRICTEESRRRYKLRKVYNLLS